jgi:hypothetical protein
MTIRSRSLAICVAVNVAAAVIAPVAQAKTSFCPTISVEGVPSLKLIGRIVCWAILPRPRRT